MTRTAEDLLDIESETWKPKEGSPAKIVGELIERTIMPGDKYGPYPFLSVLPDGSNTAWAVHAFGTVLKGEIDKLDPQVGDRVGIKYVGKPAGKDYELFKLVVIPGEGVPRSTPAPVGLPKPAPVTDVPDPFEDEEF